MRPAAWPASMSTLRSHGLPLRTRPLFRLQALSASPERLFPAIDVPIHGRVLATAGSCIVLERDGGRVCAIDMAGLRGALLSIARFQGGVISQMDLFGGGLGEQVS